nr:aminodeoxychorismate synthase component I [Gabonibacter massiliensis]
MESANKVKELMNRAGASGSSFLFGVDFELTRGFFIESPLEQQNILFDVRGVSNVERAKINGEQKALVKNPIAFEEYERKFREVRKGLLRGDSFLSNLTVATEVETCWSLVEIFHQSHGLYRLCIPENFVCFSPERFVLIEEGRISSNPMKGTIDASVPFAEEVILSDYKERSEHNTIVDLIRNDLNRVSEQVRLERFRYVDRLHTSNGDILQVSSEITGRLPEHYETFLGDIVFDLLPAGSISGAPKPATLRIISRAEGEKRGFYTGVFGLYDGKRLDTAVMIRFIEEKGRKRYFRSGGGITINSSCRSEYEEVLEKVYLPF